MSDEQGGAGAAAGAIEGAQGAGGDGGQGGGGGGEQQQQQGDRWQDKFLPEDMRSNETLAVYKDIPSLAKGLVETKAWAGGRIAVPAADATPEQFAEFVGKVRPEKADAYDITVPEGQSADLANAMRPVFHDIGLHPMQAKRLSEAWNQVQADNASRLTQANKDELTAMELDLGAAGYNQRLSAVDNMMKSLGFEDFSAVSSLESAMGAGSAMKLLFAMAEKTGELQKVDGATVQMRMGEMTPQQAMTTLQEWQKDPEKRAKYSVEGSPEWNQYHAMVKLAARPQ